MVFEIKYFVIKAFGKLVLNNWFTFSWANISPTDLVGRKLIIMNKLDEKLQSKLITNPWTFEKGGTRTYYWNVFCQRRKRKKGGMWISEKDDNNSGIPRYMRSFYLRFRVCAIGILTLQRNVHSNLPMLYYVSLYANSLHTNHFLGTYLSHITRDTCTLTVSSGPSKGHKVRLGWG